MATEGKDTVEQQKANQARHLYLVRSQLARIFDHYHFLNKAGRLDQEKHKQLSAYIQSLMAFMAVSELTNQVCSNQFGVCLPEPYASMANKAIRETPPEDNMLFDSFQGCWRKVKSSSDGVHRQTSTG